MAHVAHPHRPRVGGQGQLIAGTAVAVDVSTVSAVVLQKQSLLVLFSHLNRFLKKFKTTKSPDLSSGDGELLLTLFALSGFIVFQPCVALEVSAQAFTLFFFPIRPQKLDALVTQVTPSVYL